MTAKPLLIVVATLVLAVSAAAAWIALPALAPGLVLARVRFADPVARALIAAHGDAFAAFAASTVSMVPPPIDPWRWAHALEDMPGDAEPALIRAAADPRPGRAFLAVALLAELRDARCGWAARSGKRWGGRFAPASDAALLVAAQPGQPAGTRVMAQRVLAGQGVDAALPLIVAGLDDSDPQVRLRNAWLLARWGDTWDLPAGDRSARGIRQEPKPGAFGARGACPDLVRRLDEEQEPRVRAALVETLAFIRDETTDIAIVAAIARDGASEHVLRWLATWSSPRIAAAIEAIPEPPPSRCP